MSMFAIIRGEQRPNEPITIPYFETLLGSSIYDTTVLSVSRNLWSWYLFWRAV
jgi:hypothetical protein